jgi:maltoporin
MSARGLIFLALAVALGCGAALAADAPPPAGAAAKDAPVADSYCPNCRRPVSWDDSKCKVCGCEFDPVKPRTRKGEGKSKPAAAAGEKADESPFPAPPQGAPADKEPPKKEIIDSPWQQIQPPETSRFGFGSYGRVGIDVGTDLHGAKPLDIVDYPTRLGKGPYQELHFYYKDKLDDLPVLVKTTLAFQEELFHYDGQFSAEMAVRELYAEVEPGDLALWIGERMYRGDNIYLFDFWPLDNQNTLGGGAAYRLNEYNKIQAHVGVNRIIDHSTFFQYQEIDVPLDNAVGTRKAVFLDRNRGVASLTYALELPIGLRAKAYGEAHYLPPGSHQLEPSGVQEHLPADHGFLGGCEVGFHAEQGSFADLFFKYSNGLAAYDVLSVPFGFDTDLTVTKAERMLFGLGGALETPWAGAHFGAFWQRFHDANSIDTRNDSDQYAAAVRPMAYIGQYFRAGFELAWEGVQNKEIFPETGSKEFMMLTKFTLLAGVAPRPNMFAKPELLAFFSFKWLNQAAAYELGRTRFVDTPERKEQSYGLLAEWWF